MGFQVVGDFRGYGESDKAMIQIFTAQNLANDVINLIDHLKLEKY
jgi:pimeloyl-ACP methyl ester carboxylesterase